MIIKSHFSQKLNKIIFDANVISFRHIDADIRCDAGLTLAYAFWSRSSVLLALKNGQSALIDMQCAIANGFEQIKKDFEYYKRLAIANARKLNNKLRQKKIDYIQTTKKSTKHLKKREK